MLPFSKASGQLTFPGLIPIRKRALIGRGTHRGIPLVFWNRFSLLDDDYGQREFQYDKELTETKTNDSKSQQSQKYQGLAKNTAHYTLECLYYYSPLFHSILAQLSPILCQRDSHFPLHFHFEGISPLVCSNFSIH